MVFLMRHLLFVFALLACAALGLAPVHAAPPGLQKALGLTETAATAAAQAPAGATADNRPEDLDARRQDVSQRILVAQRTLDAAKETTAPESKPRERLSREVDLLKQLDVLYAQLQSAQESRQQLEAGKIELEQKLSDLRRDGPAEKRPYSFLLVDSLRDTLSTEESRVGTIAAAIEAATDALGREKAACDEQQANRRRIKEAAEKNSDPSKTAELATELRWPSWRPTWPSSRWPFVMRSWPTRNPRNSSSAFAFPCCRNLWRAWRKIRSFPKGAYRINWSTSRSRKRT